MLQLLSFGAGRLFSEADYCIILSHYLQLLAGFFEQSTGKQFCRSFFLISQYPFTSLIKGSDTLLWILQNCQEHHFYKIP